MEVEETKSEKQGMSRIALGGLIWMFAERISAQLVTLVVSIVLARMLSPDEYSIVAIVTIFVTIANVFATSGFGSALVQKKNTDQLDFSTTFFFSFAFSAAIYLLLFIAAPFIAAFYKIDLLTPVIRIMSIRVVIASVNSVQQAYVSKTLQFKKFFFSTLIGTAASAVVGITMAYAGFGVWALVAQYLVNVIIDTVVLSFTCGWKPSLIFSAERMKFLFSFGWKVMVATVVHTLVTQLRSLVLSKAAAPTELSYYNQGEKFPGLFINNIETSIQKVLAPILAREQDDMKRVLYLTRKSMQIAIFTIWPLLIGLAAVAESLIEFLFTAKWMGSVPYLKLVCLAYLLYPVAETHIRTIRALGRSDITMWTVFSADFLNVLLLVVAVLFRTGGTGIVVTWIIASVLMAIVNGIADYKLTGYRYIDQIRDIIKTGICSVVMYVVVNSLSVLSLHLFWKLCIQIAAGGVVYFVVALMIHREALFYTIRIVMSFLKRK